MLRRWLACACVIGLGWALAGAQQVDIVEGKGKKWAILPARFLTVGQPLMMSFSGDLKQLVFLLSDLPEDPADQRVGFFAGGNREVDWSKAKNLRVALVNPATRDVETVQLNRVGTPVSIESMGSGGFVLRTLVAPASQTTEPVQTVLFRFPHGQLLSTRASGDAYVVADAAGSQFAIVTSRNERAEGWIYQPNHEPIPIHMTTKGDIRLGSGRIFLVGSSATAALDKPTATPPPIRENVYEFDTVSLSWRPTTRKEMDRALMPFSQTMEGIQPKDVLLIAAEEANSSSPFRRFNLVARLDNKKTVIERDVSDGFGADIAHWLLVQRGDMLSVREIVPADDKWLVRQASGPEKERAMQNAKQLGVALIIFANDYDDVLPGGNNWKDKLMPYVKNESLFKDFIFLAPGVNLKTVKQPAKLMVGMVSTSSGQAQVYADGHVVWKG